MKQTIDYTALTKTIRAELNARHDRSAWDKAVTLYALDLLEDIQWSANDAERCPLTAKSLNGGRSTVQAAGSSTATAAAPCAITQTLPPVSAPRPNSSANTAEHMSPTASKRGLTCKPAHCTRLATVSAPSAAPAACIARGCSNMLALDATQWAALWYVGGMISGFLLCLVWLNNRAEQ